MQSDELECVLGQRLRSIRIYHRLTQEQLAERANISVGAVKHIESGSGSTISTMVKVLRVLGQEDWIKKLGAEPVSFNPLDLLSARQGRDARNLTPPSRVRRRRDEVR